MGSVGTRAWTFLLEGSVEAEVLLLQGKQAEASAPAGYAGATEYANQGERVVAGQHLMQAASDIFLGWLRVQSPDGRGEDYYLRQLRDWKLSAEIELMRPRAWRCTPGCAAGRWPARMPALATATTSTASP